MFYLKFSLKFEPQPFNTGSNYLKQIHQKNKLIFNKTTLIRNKFKSSLSVF